MALTGSANKDAIQDIKHNLAMRDPVCLAQSFNRPNLHYSVRKKPTLKKDLVQNIAGFIKTHHPNNTGIIYALSRAESEEMAQKLREEWGIEARHYHAGIDSEERKLNQDDWMAGRCKVIVATARIRCYSMSHCSSPSNRLPLGWELINQMVCVMTLPGDDDPDLYTQFDSSFTQHYQRTWMGTRHFVRLASAWINGFLRYYQETGRAGRDGRSSDCVLCKGFFPLDPCHSRHTTSRFQSTRLAMLSKSKRCFGIPTATIPHAINLLMPKSNARLPNSQVSLLIVAMNLIVDACSFSVTLTRNLSQRIATINATTATGPARLSGMISPQRASKSFDSCRR